MTAPTTTTVECPKCSARWGGLNTAHCSACHRTFSGIKAFDAHREGSHSRSTRHCVDPESVTNLKGEQVLKPSGRAYPCWSLSGTWTGPESA